MFIRKGLFLDQDTGGAGGGAAGGTGAPGGQPPAGGTGAPGGQPPAGGSGGPFDWKSAGVDDLGLAVITDRGWKSPGDLLTSYRNLEKLTGVPPDQIIKLPKADDAKGYTEVFKRLGMPESADKYTIPLPEGDKGEFAKVARDWFHDANLTQSQVTKLSQHWNTHLKAQNDAAMKEIEASNVKDISELKSKWGADYDKNSAVVDKAAETFGMTQEQLNALKSVLGPKAAMEFLHTIGSKLGVESGDVPGMGAGKGAGFAMTAEQAKAEITRLKQDRDFVKLFNSTDPKTRMEARAEMDKLSRIAYPGESTFR